MTGQRAIEKLNAEHGIQAFDCGQADLNRWFGKFALQNQSAHSAKTYVGLDGDTVIGFYSLTVGQVEFDHAAGRLRQGLAEHPVPVMLLARLAVHKEWQGRKVGRALLRDAVLKFMQTADIIGIRALVVHAKDDAARRYHEQFGFMQSPTDPLHLYALLKDLKALIRV